MVCVIAHHARIGPAAEGLHDLMCARENSLHRVCARRADFELQFPSMAPERIIRCTALRVRTGMLCG